MDRIKTDLAKPQSRKERQKKDFAALRLCERVVFSNGTKTGSMSYNNVKLFSSAQIRTTLRDLIRYSLLLWKARNQEISGKTG
jgi:hypothetical protein